MGEIVVRGLIRWQKHRTNRKRARAGPRNTTAKIGLRVAETVVDVADAVEIADAAETVADAAQIAADVAVIATARPKLTWKN
jgi:hypothetical protein